MKPAEIILDNNTKPIYQEIHIEVPDGFEIDRENSTFECIKLKPIQSRFSDYDGTYHISGYWLNGDIHCVQDLKNIKFHQDVFATEKQAKSALAMAQISQIMANDERFGGTINDEEWSDINMYKSVITRDINKITFHSLAMDYHFLAFHTEAQGKLFLKENEQLVKDYLMID